MRPCVFLLCGVVAVILADVALPHGGPADCTQVCDRRLEPVCARDGLGRNRTYPSRCMLGYLNCKERAYNELVAEGACPDDPVFKPDDEEVAASGAPSP